MHIYLYISWNVSGRVAWRREEALAYIFAVEMVDLPLSESQAKFEDEFGSQQSNYFLILFSFHELGKTFLLF